MEARNYKLTTFCIYKTNESGAIMINCKNGAIIYIDTNLPELLGYIECGFQYIEENEMQKLLVEKGFFIDCTIDEQREAQIAYNEFYKDVTDIHQYLGLTIDLKNESNIDIAINEISQTGITITRKDTNKYSRHFFGNYKTNKNMYTKANIY